MEFNIGDRIAVKDNGLKGVIVDRFKAENLVAVRFYEDKGDKSTIIGRAHGHVFHEGAEGIAQAGSYALKRLLEKINDGHYDLRKTVLKEENR